MLFPFLFNIFVSYLVAFSYVFFIILSVMLPWILFSVMHLFLMSVNDANYLVVDEKSLSGI